MENINAIFLVVILILSVVVHEFAHGYVAWLYGDDTAEEQGRLTLNPIKHFDLFGSLIVPFILVITHAPFVLGWAKPVPYNVENLRNPKWSVPLVSVAGIVANLLIAIFFGALMRLAPVLGIHSSGFFIISSSIVFINIVLAIFNLMPVPPLDGSNILFSLLPSRFRKYQVMLEQFSIVLLILFILFLWKFLTPAILFLYSLFSGSVLQ